ncbi:protein of unknown function [Lentzea xinjiangensis]|uniref:DUF4331 domain-containing protein n=1 Tax=Lentzea xinjiangensis TaxID=402600 RepID=A0A1H9QFJ9_9PSEU|nr:DUF4331 domain-containing protein [Lentzea xinjiangensis]SER59321.1 protein of unknown function [Lentzea xinjiangensis]
MSSPHVLSGRRGQVAAAALVGATLLNAAMFGGTGATASSHREAPLVASNPAVDNTDLYAFVSPDHKDTVTLVGNWFPFQEPNGGPNFYPWAEDAQYDFNIDNDGDAKADVILRWQFRNDDRRKNNTFLYANGVVDSLDDENLLFRQRYDIEAIYENGQKVKLISNAPVAPSPNGAAAMPDFKKLRDQAVLALPGGGKVYVGPAEDSFFLDLRVFDLLYGGNLSEVGQDTLRGYNVNSIAIQLPKQALALKNDAHRNPNIGVWSTTQRRTLKLSPGKAEPQGDFVQVSRLGNPLVNEVVAPAGLKDAFNGLRPDQDAGVKELVDRVVNPELPKLIEGIYKIPAPQGQRDDLAEIFLTGITKKLGGQINADLNSQINNADADKNRFRPSEMLRLNMMIDPNPNPNRLGLLGGDQQGFPNGRRLTDDVVDIGIQAFEGAAATGKLVEALAAGDKVDANDQPFEANFPYLALPRNGTAVNASGTEANIAVNPVGRIASLDPMAMTTAVGSAFVFGAGFWLWRKRQQQIRRYGSHSK